MEKKLLHIKKQMELLKYSIENDAIQKLEPLTNYYFIQAKQIAISTLNNKEIINAINNVKNNNINELSNNVDMIIAWINTLIIDSKIIN